MPEVEGFGTILQSGDASGGSSTTWTDIAKIVNIEPPEEDTAKIKNTNMSSANHAHTYQAGLTDPGECKITTQWDKVNAVTLRALRRVQKDYRVRFADGTGGVASNGSTLRFDGFLSKIGPKTPMEDIVTNELTFQASGLPVFTAGT